MVCPSRVKAYVEEQWQQCVTSIDTTSDVNICIFILRVSLYPQLRLQMSHIHFNEYHQAILQLQVLEDLRTGNLVVSLLVINPCHCHIGMPPAVMEDCPISQELVPDFFAAATSSFLRTVRVIVHALYQFVCHYS